jgi:hypothetical protein
MTRARLAITAMAALTLLACAGCGSASPDRSSAASSGTATKSARPADASATPTATTGAQPAADVNKLCHPTLSGEAHAFKAQRAGDVIEAQWERGNTLSRFGVTAEQFSEGIDRGYATIYIVSYSGSGQTVHNPTWSIDSTVEVSKRVAQSDVVPAGTTLAWGFDSCPA